jgi:hypothetical protein
MNTATRSQELNPMLFPVSGKHHVWTEQELRAECMTVDESQQDLHQMIDELFDQKERQYAGSY